MPSWKDITRTFSMKTASETLYALDEPTTGLRPSDVATLMKQQDGRVESGNTVVVVEHDMTVAAASD